jgi:mRNA interferase RelE/StbE
MTYEIVFRDTARKAFLALDPAIRKRVGKVIDRLAENPRPTQATTLLMTDLTIWRVRAGDWRVLYEVHDDRLVVLVVDVGHRSTVYRKQR